MFFNSSFIYISSSFSKGPVLNSNYFSLDLSYEEQILKRKSAIYLLNNSFIQDIALSTKPVDVEAKFYSKKQKEHSFFGSLASGSFYLTSNPKIPSKIYQYIEEKISTEQALNELKSSFDEYYLSKLLSVGVFGLNKKQIPTKQAITATDLILSKLNIEKILDFNQINSYYFSSISNFYNTYFVVLFPGYFSFENFENWDGALSYDYESYKGKTRYSHQAGGYYASRLAVTNYLLKIKKQAGVLIIREIDKKYSFSLGSWQIRENIKRALSSLKKVDLDFLLSNKKIKDYLLRSSFFFQTHLF